MLAPHGPLAGVAEADSLDRDADGVLAGALVLAATVMLAAEAGGSSTEPSVKPKKAAMKIALIVNRWGPNTSPSS